MIAQLRQENNLYAAIINSSSDVIISKTPDCIITSWNPAAEKLYGYSAKKAIGKPIDIIIPPEKKKEINDILRRIRQGEVISNFETIRKSKKGQIIPVSVTISPIKNEKGKIIGFSSIARDIRNRVDNEKRFQNILEATPDAIIIINDDGIINFVNTQTEKLFGYEREKLIGKPVEKLIPQPYRQRHPIHRANFFLNPRPRPMGSGMELYGQRKNKEIFPVEISLSPLETKEGVIALAAVRDITERKLAEERFKKILEAAPDAIVIINEDGVINFVNNQTEKLFGYTPTELIGQVVEKLIPEPYRNKHPAHRADYFLNPHPRPMGIGMELFGQRKNGEIFPVEISLSPLKIKEGMIALATIRDITERKKIEKLKSEFLSVISHELKTPLTSIQGAIDLIAGMDQLNLNSDGVKKLLGVAKQNTRRLSTLIHDILNIEKMESGKAEFKLQVISIEDLTKEAINNNKPYADKFNIEIKLKKSDPNIYVNVDTGKLLQVFDNLISNAIKFSNYGKEVIINIKKLEKIVRVEISDKGIGISKDFLPHIFEKFAQADTSSTRKHEGTGLGLSITKAIIEKHGGTIHFKTQLNKGTTFYFDLPIVKNGKLKIR